ncbi:hypothetical protein [Actinoallomurus iriomotensis]|uniref:hypothetical protein n=1 Tax=Actinoallomurus iriomotensis TaxID=478107 RepID=UPI00255455D2|nr:hypothetical protein [Actinoallomurus iriomotensis]
MPDQHGRTAAEFTVRREGDRVRITAWGKWRLRTAGLAVLLVGEQVEHTADGILVRAAARTGSLTLASRSAIVDTPV